MERQYEETHDHITFLISNPLYCTQIRVKRDGSYPVRAHGSSFLCSYALINDCSRITSPGDNKWEHFCLPQHQHFWSCFIISVWMCFKVKAAAEARDTAGFQRLILSAHALKQAVSTCRGLLMCILHVKTLH